MGITQSIAYALQSLGRAVPDIDTLTAWIGPPIQDSFADLFAGEDASLVDLAVAKFRERFATIGIYENSVYDGVPLSLEQLSARGATLILATSKPQPFADRILEHFSLRQYFSAVYGSTFGGALSNKADLIAHILAERGLAGSSAVMVGDRKYDVLGAAKSRVPCVGVLYGYGSREELLEAGAAALCEHPCDLVALLDSIQ